MTLAHVIHDQVTALPPEKQAQVLDFVLFLQQRTWPVEPEDNAIRRCQLAAALETLRRLGTFADIADPVSWQRDVRRDRSLAGREDE